MVHMGQATTAARAHRHRRQSKTQTLASRPWSAIGAALATHLRINNIYAPYPRRLRRLADNKSHEGRSTPRLPIKRNPPSKKKKNVRHRLRPLVSCSSATRRQNMRCRRQKHPAGVCRQQARARTPSIPLTKHPESPHLRPTGPTGRARPDALLRPLSQRWRFQPTNPMLPPLGRFCRTAGGPFKLATAALARQCCMHHTASWRHGVILTTSQSVVARRFCRVSASGSAGRLGRLAQRPLTRLGAYQISNKSAKPN